jgi:glycosyltransferase involved in cell wall biosynthesis
MKRLLQYKVKRCGMLIGVSRSVVEETRLVLKCSGAKIRCVYNSVDSQVFSSVGTRADLDRLAGLAPSPPGSIRVGLVGTFARWKGHKTFLGALSAIPRSVAVRGYIVGGPVYSTIHSQYSFEELKTICRNLAIEDRIGFTGFCDRPAEIIRSLDIVVHASDSPEPFGMVLAEAMIAGTPIISTGIGGSAELCTDGVESLTFESGNAADLAGKIVRLAGDASLRRRMIAAGTAKAERLFHPERAAGEVLSVYRGLMGANFAVPGSIETAAQESAKC